MHQPYGFVDKRFPHYGCRLRKALYGLKQAPHAWYQRFANYLLHIGFVIRKSDTSLFMYKQGSDMANLLIYVDDIILCTCSNSLRDRLIGTLKTKFPMSDLGSLIYFLAIFVTLKSSYVLLSQQKYAQEILEFVVTPINTNSKLSADLGPPVSISTHYCSLAGAL